MSHVTQEAQLRRLCSQPETFARAQALFYTAKAKTGPGSGYELGQGAIGLPAICARIASEELMYNDVSEKVAQAASCLAPKIFANAMNIVRAALAPPIPKPTITYESLVTQRKFARGTFMTENMLAVERTLAASGVLRGRMEPPCDLVTLVVFCWTCKLLRIRKVTREGLLQEYDITASDFEYVWQTLDSTCDAVAKHIERKAAKIRAEMRNKSSAAGSSSSAAPTPTPSPTKSVSKSPSKSALRSLTHTPSNTPSHKRKVAFMNTLASGGDDNEDDDSEGVPETPTKRQRLLTPPVPNHTPTPRGKRLPALDFSPAKTGHLPDLACSSKSTLDLMQAVSADDSDSNPLAIGYASSSAGPSTPRRPRQTERSASATPRPHAHRQTLGLPEQEEDEEPVARRRRYRPVFLDQQQWMQRDPRVEKEWRAAIKMKNELVAQYGHPFAMLEERWKQSCG